MSLLIKVEVITHSEHRYPTVGDWQFINTVHSTIDDKGTVTDEDNTIESIEVDEVLTVRVSKMSDRRYEYLVAIHEIVEALLCKYNGVSEESVDDWDMNHLDSGDPANESGCPYWPHHFLAQSIEYNLAVKIETDWEKYCDEVDSL